jgi:hypothetical protein
VKERSES